MTTYDPNYRETPVLSIVGQKVVVFNQNGQVLVLRRSEKSSRPGGWDFPGGGLNLGEDPTEGIIRETLEETQLTITDIAPIHVAASSNNKGEFVVTVGYQARTTQSVPQLSWEHDAYQWLSREEALQLELPPMHRAFLEKALDSFINPQD